MINGYAKTAQDAQGRELDWYHGNRRVLSVEWVFDDGTTVVQDLDDTTDLQSVDVDVTTTTITVRLLEVSAPGNGPAARDYTAISELSLRRTPASESRASTAAAFSASSRETSRWVTMRTAVGPTVATSTPSARAAATKSAASGAVDDHDVGVHAGRVDAAGLGQQPRVRVVVGEPLDVVVERVQPGGREDADLAHAAAHPLAPHPRLGDGVAAARPAPSRPGRRAPWTGRPTARPRSRRTPRAACRSRRARSRSGRRRGGCAAPTPVGELAQVAQVAERQHRAAGEVVGVLDRDRRGRHEERPHVRGEQALDRRQVDLAPRVRSRCAW